MALISSAVTRGLVVSTRDPLFSGRVKVWIPVLHGKPADEPIENRPADDGESAPSIITDTKGIVNLQDFTDDGRCVNADSLPWAYVLGHNWAPAGHLTTGEALDPVGRPSGVMSVPKVGTEVFIIFEDDNPDCPIIIGSVFHTNEFLALSSITPLEIAPGLNVSGVSDIETSESTLLSLSDYEQEVSKSYVIRSSKGSSLIISDIYGKEQILLGGSISWDDKGIAFNNGPGTLYHTFASNYPNFPTTASAPFAKRTAITKFSNVPTVNISSPTSSTTTTSTTTPSTTSIATGKYCPVGANFTPPHTPAMQFMAPRGEGRLHLGIDLGCAIGSALVAPSDGYVLYYKLDESKAAGNYLVFKGIDGYCHRFMHLKTIEKSVSVNVLNSKFPLIKAGSKIGETGNTGRASNGIAYAPHLHWEILPLITKSSTGSNYSYADKVTSKNVNEVFSLARLPGGGYLSNTSPSIFISRASYIDPMKSWLSVDTGTPLIITGNQAESIQQTLFPVSGDIRNNKLIGLEVCLTPGKEHIYLRHSSGSYFGFDADGNFTLFTVGDIQARVNRSVVIDVFGSITTSCLAMFTRVKTILRTVTAKLISTENSNKFDINKVTATLDSTGQFIYSDGKSTYGSFPQALYEIDITRAADMKDAIAASSSNFYVTTELGTKTLPALVLDDSRIVLSDSDKPKKEITITKYDRILEATFNKYLGNNNKSFSVLAIKKTSDTSGASQYFNWKFFKAQMIQESNQDPTAHSTADAWGLFQLRLPAIQEVIGRETTWNGKVFVPVIPEVWHYDGSNIESYIEEEKNIDAAIQYYKICLQQVYNAVISVAKEKKAAGETDLINPQDLTVRQKDALMKIALVAYTAGYSIISRYLKEELRTNGLSALSYVLIEDALVRAKAPKEQILYVPKITNWIYPQLR